MSFLELKGITREWNGQGGVKNVSFALPRGAFMSILGPSGCGKSTLLRLIAGLEQPQAGQIHIEGRDVTARPAAQRNLSMVFQSYALFPHLSVADNVLFGLKVRRIGRSEQVRRLDKALEMTGLQGLEHRKPAQLSGGQRQRVALARAAVAEKPLCLMDEPLSNLDAKLRHSVRRDIRALARALGLTVVYVTHDQGEAMSLSDIVVLMNAGRIEQIGSPQDLFQRPATTFAAQFIGEPPMALVDGPGLALNDDVIAGIRPEAVALRPIGAGDLTATIKDIEFLGSKTRIALTHPAAHGLAAFVAGSTNLALWQMVDVSIPENDRLLFNAQTGKLEKEPQQNSETRIRQNTASGIGPKAPFHLNLSTKPAQKEP
ncbi:ABC transporter ATP-binding protein [Falsiruegeria mediterranea]|uniref:sn-glycerol-3-phosphate import ATP-binding protein UgpC n=1 Tax=Falsiruegeria mediterranea M17 TaxID=1200281 RepID=A0A2R8CGD7_9RHOB|nr:ABC transporter ATP-binding protein [Falsiruegeria mediterranea]SPJ31467.1 sn-glycerol-3-phosphate import ATP-binding protein UgpC [Falsiruegeria mediterranea M17]